ncbi:MAG: ubiquinol-cytochrome c reductase iron-sulfur subunit, partial [Nitrospinota bacterium]
PVANPSFPVIYSCQHLKRRYRNYRRNLTILTKGCVFPLLHQLEKFSPGLPGKLSGDIVYRSFSGKLTWTNFKETMLKSAPAPNTDLVRRRLVKSLFGLFALFGSAFLYSVFRYLLPPGEEKASSKTEILSLPLDDIETGGYLMARYKGKPVIVVRTEHASVVALSATCSHLGCIVKWNQEANQLNCPCHAAKFDLDGKVLSGPAPKPLPVYPAKISDGKILVG